MSALGTLAGDRFRIVGLWKGLTGRDGDRAHALPSSLSDHIDRLAGRLVSRSAADPSCRVTQPANKVIKNDPDPFAGLQFSMCDEPDRKLK